jgi:hypothetical protein
MPRPNIGLPIFMCCCSPENQTALNPVSASSKRNEKILTFLFFSLAVMKSQRDHFDILIDFQAMLE